MGETELAEASNSNSISGSTKKTLLLLSSILLSVGCCGGPLIMRLYFLHGGKRIWLSSFLQTAGCPVMLIPIIIFYLRRRRDDGAAATLFQLKLPLFLVAVFVGLVTGLDNYMYAYGVARIPVSTSSLIIASQLGFTALFAYLLVKQKFTPYSVNTVVLLTVGAGVLALHTDGDRPEGESKREYMLGFVLTVAAAVLYGPVMPLIEREYGKAKQTVTYVVVIEFQMVMCLFATLFCAVGMVANNDFRVIPREAKEFELGETEYYVILVFTALIWQGFFLGAIGAVYYGSALFVGIVNSALLPVTEVLAVVFYHESFKAEKGVALILSLWGFASYFYGEIKQKKKQQQQQQVLVVDHNNNNNSELELPTNSIDSSIP